MFCPQCGTENPSGEIRCRKCTTILPVSLVPGPAISPETIALDVTAPVSAGRMTRDAATTGDPAFDKTSTSGWQAAPKAVSTPASPSAFSNFAPGSVIGTRYEILQLLGEGGMGAVYKVRDREVNRLVALKMIRADLASHPEILARFTQELVLARQVTHRNVIRLFDLGEANGVKYITMDFIEGRDLKSLLNEKGKLATAEAIKVIGQVCRALDAAHTEGVVHRDLKPQNIMLDANSRVTVMDFGIARSAETSGMTQTGALIGTPEYMSPEQARGQIAGVPSDLFTVGIIFYELLTGVTPYKADTAMASLLKRTQERARPPIERDPSIPPAVSAVVMKCLEIDPAKRYSSAVQILADLGVAGETAAGTMFGTHAGSAPPGKFARYGKWIAVALAAVLVIAGALLRNRIFPTITEKHAPVTLLISDFENKTGDSVFDGTLEPMLGIALEGAPFISSYNRITAQREAAKLDPGAKLTEKTAQLVAVRDGISVVVGGSIEPSGSGYKVSVEAVDAATGKPIVSKDVEADNKQEVLAAAGKLAAGIRAALGDTTPESVQLTAAETFTAGSLEAAHAYAAAQAFQYQGKWDDAIREYQHAIQLDPNLGRAYAGLGAVEANLGHDEDAEKYYLDAMSKIDRMTERERYRTRGGYYLMRGEPLQAIEEYTALVNQFPSDTAGYANLALAYFYTRNMAKALEEGKKAIEISPKNVVQRNNVALYALYAGDFDTAAREEQTVLEMNSSFEKAYEGLALAQLGQGKPADATATWQKLQSLSARGASKAATGLADLASYEGRITDAEDLLSKGVIGDQAIHDVESASDKLAALAVVQQALGKNSAAIASADAAAKGSKDESVYFRAGRVYLGAGQDPKLRLMDADLAARISHDSQAYAKILEGESQLAHGNAKDAIETFQQAQKLADMWLAHFDLGRAYLDSGAFPEASSQFDTCLKRKGEATSIFLDDVPSYHFLPPVYYYQGRAQEGMKSSGAADSYKAFLDIKKKAPGDPLAADARKRLASLK
ncbi:MAG: protein kinase domain-containing protein [Terriglobales bacterium]